jgi:hypothetical protein
LKDGYSSHVVNFIIFRLLEERTHHEDEGVINDLRAALDVERSNALELMKHLKLEHDKVKKVAVELNQVTEQSSSRLSKVNELEDKIDRLQVR